MHRNKHWFTSIQENLDVQSGLIIVKPVVKKEEEKTHNANRQLNKNYRKLVKDRSEGSKTTLFSHNISMLSVFGIVLQ